MKLARTIRFDPSDLNVFQKAAEDGEWALVGTFCFADVTPDALNGKLRQAFSNGFLGVESFGFSTLVSVVSVRDGDADRLAEQVASAFVERLGARLIWKSRGRPPSRRLASWPSSARNTRRALC